MILGNECRINIILLMHEKCSIYDCANIKNYNLIKKVELKTKIMHFRDLMISAVQQELFIECVNF